MKLLLIEDEPTLAEALSTALRGAGYALDCVDRLGAADAAILVATYDAVLLDLYLPDGEGIAWLRRQRAQANNTPVLIITARDQISDRILGLQSGADDYLIKPFDIDELLARLAAVIRRVHGSASPWLELGSLRLDLAGKRAECHAGAIEFTAKEWAVLGVLAARPGRVIHKDSLEQALYSFDDDVGSNTLEVYVSRIRKKIGRERIDTVRGLGYRLVLDPPSMTNLAPHQ